MSECTHDCSTCKSGDCKDRKESLVKELNKYSSVKKVIGIVSGKGGVGKSMVTALTAVSFARKGYKTAIMDADILGPSIPKMFGINERAKGSDLGLMPVSSKNGTKIMSINLLLENDSDPVVWRGPVVGGVVTQFWTDVIWGDVDYMFVDMPPGTGDVPLTVFQSIKLDGIIIVTTPQELVSMIVEKAVKMANLMNVPILGVVENMSYIACPNCDEKIYIYGESKVQNIINQYSLPLLAQIPITKDLAQKSDLGQIEEFKGDFLDTAVTIVETVMKNK